MGRPGSKPAGLFARLAGDVRANTLAIMAAAMIPLIGMVGGAVDLSRMYIVKTRLQHACDAGALAGRKAMGGGTWAQSNGYPGKAAAQFFKANISDNAYGATSIVSEYKESAGKVTGTASAVVPMTLMRVFDFDEEKLTVTCDAEMRLPNTDVMFVLDTTGSMASAAGSDNVSKIAALKVAVKCFYEIVARLDSEAQCTTGNPSGGTGDQVQIRFGFMPYSVNVNVGRLLPTSFFADTWTYQSREAETTTTYTTTWVQSGQTVRSDRVGVSFFLCSSSGVSSLNEASDTTVGGVRTVTNVIYTSPTLGFFSCTATKTTTVTTYTSVSTPRTTFVQWRYKPVSLPVGGLKNGTSWKSGLTLPIGFEGGPQTVNWSGCIEERPTVARSTYTPIPSDAYDMDIDLVPTSNNPASLWGPALKDVIYFRDVTTSWSQLSNSLETRNKGDFRTVLDDNCPTEARKLQTWPNATAFDAYVNSLETVGNTYHDVGITWGARFMSPTGIFATENASTPKGGEIERHMIFMTDGDTQAAPCDYSSHGVAFFDRRTTSDVGTASNCPYENNALNAQVDARFTAICSEVKKKNITLWVISFGSMTTETKNRLQTCATPGRYFTANDAAALQATFKSIADQISQLRLTK
jgi:Flp pilus assembly protein TadG